MGVNEILREMGVNFESMLIEQSERDLASLLTAAIGMKSKNMNQREVKGFLARLLLDEEYFSTEDLLSALDSKSVKLDLGKLLEEPRSEKEMKNAVREEFRGEKFMVATEIPLPREKGRPPRIDVAVMKKGIFGSTLIGFELKKSYGRLDVMSGFSQAQHYTKFCDEAYVALTPMTYLRQSDIVRAQMKEHREIGVWIVNSRKRLAILSGSVSQEIPRANKEAVIKAITASCR